MNKNDRPKDAAEGGPGYKIDYEEIRRLIALLEEKNLSLFELEVEGFKVKISRAVPSSPAITLSPAAPSSMEKPMAAVAAPLPPREAEGNTSFITSPMVGTFYRAPSPSSPPFVEIGDNVKKGQTLCIIEAMKLMNEIESDVDGVVTDIFSENAKPVEYGQRLFAILPQA